MFDPSANDLIPLPLSPTISSISSSSKSSASSFFHDRSTTLGTLMALDFQTITSPSQPQPQPQPHIASATLTDSRKKKQSLAATSERWRRWWSLCREDDARPGSLGEYFKVERKLYGLPLRWRAATIV